MNIKLTLADQDRVNELDIIRKENFKVLEIFADCLNNGSRFITDKEIQILTKEGGLEVEQAFRELLAAEGGLDMENSRNDRHLFQIYFKPSVKKLDSHTFENDSYYRFLAGRSFKTRYWELKQTRWDPYEIFVRDDLIVTNDFREIPQLGFFDCPYYFPVILQDAREWMTITPNEVATMKVAIDKCHGRVVTYGLGLGYFAFKASEKDSTEEVVIVESDIELISLFKQYLLPDFPFREKIRIVPADAFEYAKNIAPFERFDFAFVDLWHDLGDGLEPYLRMKRLERLQSERLHSGTFWSYWVETTLLSTLRWSLFSILRQAMYQETDIPIQKSIETFDDFQSCLTDDFLKNLAGTFFSKVHRGGDKSW